MTQKTVRDAVEHFPNGIGGCEYIYYAKPLTEDLWLACDSSTESPWWQLVCTRAQFEAEVEARQREKALDELVQLGQEMGDYSDDSTEKNREQFGTDCHPDEVAFKQPEWNGEGRPPVGTICDAAFEFVDGEPRGNANTIEVMYSDCATVVGRIISGAHEGVFSNGFEVWLYSFRPLKTEAEKEREELENAVFQASGIRARDGGKESASYVADALIKAGYRKQEESQ